MRTAFGSRVLLATAAAAGLALASPGEACGPPPTLRELVRDAVRVVLVRAVDRQHVPSGDCACCDGQERVVYQVIETWKGPHEPYLELIEWPGGEGAAPPPAASLLVLFATETEAGESPVLFPRPVRTFRTLDAPEIAVLRDAVERGLELAASDPPDPERLRAHVLESLRHAATRLDGLLEAWRPRWARRPEIRFDDDEARELADVVAKELATGDELAAVGSLLGGRLTPSFRALALRRLDEAFASEKPVPWADPLLRVLDADATDLCDRDDDETPAAEEPGTTVPPSEPAGDAEEPEVEAGAAPDPLESDEAMEAEIRAFEARMREEEARRLACWTERRARWSERRPTLEVPARDPEPRRSRAELPRRG